MMKSQKMGISYPISSSVDLATLSFDFFAVQKSQLFARRSFEQLLTSDAPLNKEDLCV